MRPRRPRAVLDTQLLIRAFHTARGATGGLVRALQDDRFHLIIQIVSAAGFLRILHD
jgi:predicted nucleic acid-binding protein